MGNRSVCVSTARKRIATSEHWRGSTLAMVHSLISDSCLKVTPDCYLTMACRSVLNHNCEPQKVKLVSRNEVCGGSRDDQRSDKKGSDHERHETHKKGGRRQCGFNAILSCVSCLSWLTLTYDRRTVRRHHDEYVGRRKPTDSGGASIGRRDHVCLQR